MNVIHILCDTLRRDHCGPYHQGRPLNQVDSPEQPDWVVPTPNLDRLAARGTVFERAYAGSTPCMPARRDIYTGRYEFPERGWGPLEEGDLDLPSLLSPRPGHPITAYGPDDVVSYFISDHKNMWCAGSGNYHFGFTGFEFIRGQQEDPWATTSDPFYCPPPDLPTKLERYWRNKHRFGDREQDMPVARTFSTAAEWLRRNAGHRGFYLQIDEFDPHEPWDPPEEILRQFDPRGYYTADWSSHPRLRTVARADGRRRTAQLPGALRRQSGAGRPLAGQGAGRHGRTRPVAQYHGDRAHRPRHLQRRPRPHRQAADARVRGQEHDPVHRLPPRSWAMASGARQLVQNVDIYATVLAAFGRELPADRHGVNLLPVLADPAAPTRDYAIAGQFARSATITDGRWTLHQGPDPEQPLYWHGYHQQRFLGGPHTLGPYADGRRRVVHDPVPADYLGTWLSDLQADPSERFNVADRHPARVAAMREALGDTFDRLGAPSELRARFRL